MQELTKLISPAFQLSIALLVLSVGLRTTWADVTYLFRQPQLLLRSIVARNVIVPAMTILLVQVMRLDPRVNAALLALSIAAVPPVLPQSLLKAGGRQPYVLGLLTTQSVLAIVFVPVSLMVFNEVLGLRARFAPRQVVPVIMMLTLLPLAIGLVFRRLVPSWSDRAAKTVHAVGGIVLALAFIGVVAVAWRAWLTLLGNGTLLAMILLVAIGLGAGHLLGGPRHEDRKSLSLACASSHPGLAMAMIGANATAANAGVVRLASAAVLLYFIVQSLATLPFKRPERTVASGALFRSGLDRRSRKRSGSDRRGATA